MATATMLRNASLLPPPIGLSLTWCLVMTIVFMGGCDTVYHYVVYPPQRIEYTLVPDEDLVAGLHDSLYSVSEDKRTAIFDKKDFKVELKYLSDYHLNNVEFLEQSQSGLLSTNPFTYANWIDPQTGYTPQRFSVFKVTIYNYAGGKLNLDPENSFLITDRGDFLNSYGREEKNSRYESLEAYFKKRKGTSGVEDDIFESRMGIVRRTLLYLGKPVFRGDVRDGLLVFDPLADGVEHVKIDIREFITGYDENNQPSSFTSLAFYFKRVPFIAPEAKGGYVAGREDTSGARRKRLIRRINPDARPAGDAAIAVKTTNVTPVADLLKPVDAYLAEFTNFKMSYTKTTLFSRDLKSSNILLIIGDEGKLSFTADQAKITAEFVRDGGLIIADERSSTAQSENWQTINNFLTEIGSLLGPNVTYGRIPTDHPIYSVWKRFDALPPCDIELLNVQNRIVNDFLGGIFYQDRLVAVISNRGYSTAWGAFGPPEFRSGKDYTRHRELLSNILYYAIESKRQLTVDNSTSK